MSSDTTEGTTIEDVLEHLKRVYHDIKPDLNHLKHQMQEVRRLFHRDDVQCRDVTVHVVQRILLIVDMHAPNGARAPPAHISSVGTEHVVLEGGHAADIAGLQAVVAQLQKDKAESDANTTLLARNLTQCQADLRSKEQAAAEALKEARDLKVSNVRLRNIITKQANNIGEIPDSDIVQKYVNIRAKVQTLIHAHCSVDGLPKPIIKSRSLQDETWLMKHIRSFYTEMAAAKPDEAFRQYRLRAGVFRILARNLLHIQTFGVAEAIDLRLGEFERLVNKCAPDKIPEFMEWRCRTTRCAQWLQSTSPLPKDTADDVLDFLKPMWPKSTGPNTVPPRMQALVEQICNQTHELCIMIRQSTAEYAFEDVPRDTVYIDEQADFLPMDTEGDRKQHIGSKVRLTLFDSLVKYPDIRREARDRHVLEKAHVTLY